MKRLSTILPATALAGVLTASPAAGLVPAPAAASTTCRTPWGSTPEQGGLLGGARVVGVRTGAHPCFDRLVVDLAGTTGGYRVAYVPQVLQDPRGTVVPLRGGARLQVTVLADSGTRRVALPSVAGMRTFRQLAAAGSFEGVTTYGLGVRARLPFRVLVLGGSSPRLVLDVAHHW